MSTEKRTTFSTTDNSLFPSFKWYETSNELDTWSGYLNSGFTLKESLFKGVKLAEMMIQINTSILVMVLDSIRVQNSHYFDGSVG